MPIRRFKFHRQKPNINQAKEHEKEPGPKIPNIALFRRQLFAQTAADNSGNEKHKHR